MRDRHAAHATDQPDHTRTADVTNTNNAPDAPAQPARMTLAAFTAVVDRQQHALYVFVCGLVGDQEQARDLTQDAFHDAWRAAQAATPPFVADTPIEEQRRWLFTVAYRKAASALRRRRLIRWESLDVSDYSADEPASNRKERSDVAAIQSLTFEDQISEGEALRAALASLSPQDAACLLLRIVQGFGVAEVAQIVGASPEVVTKRFSRARQRLRAAYLAQNDATHEETPR
ncbi:MAG TPA: sigma-70 family RNA polymerase sigma factor [Ktedonobacterales bacterium]|nr:sigma-70 family RNA polymerase sigma factor [Ktedonobacterales bacterium]